MPSYLPLYLPLYLSPEPGMSSHWFHTCALLTRGAPRNNVRLFHRTTQHSGHKDTRLKCNTFKTFCLSYDILVSLTHCIIRCDCIPIFSNVRQAQRTLQWKSVDLVANTWLKTFEMSQYNLYDTASSYDIQGVPEKKLFFELLNSIKGAPLCWMFKISNALLYWMISR